MKTQNRMKRKKNSKKKIFINGRLRLDKFYLFASAFLLVLIGMNVGYAIYNNKIERQNKIDVEILDVSIYSKTIGATSLYNPTYQNLSTSLNLCLSSKTDSITYLVTIKNNADESVILKDILINNTNNSDITFMTQNMEPDDFLPAKTAKTIKIKVTYKDNLETISNKCVGMTLNLNFIKTN